MEVATFGGGCFWCLEAPFRRLRGVDSVVSGYAGGTVENPTYRQVCSGTTGHAEVIQVEYDPAEISYGTLLEVFFALHDPTTRNRQGPDVGSQYRSIILAHDEEQLRVAESVIARLEGDVYEGIVTELQKLDTFYPAEEKHQRYYEKHPDRPYCRAHIPPKLKKLEERFEDHVEETR